MLGHIELSHIQPDQEAALDEPKTLEDNALMMGLKSDYILILTEMKKHHKLDLIPVAFQDNINDIERVSGTPLNNLLGGVVDCGTGLFLYAMGGTLASEFTALTPIQRYALAASPLLLSGLLRIVVAAVETDYGRGKEGINALLCTSIVGVAGIVTLLSTVEDLSTITVNDWSYWLFMTCNILSGKGVAAYSAGMTLTAKAAPGDTPEDWIKHLQNISTYLSTPIIPNVIERTIPSVLRKGPAEYMALVAGISNLAPGITLIMARSLLIPAIGLRNTYIIFAGITLMGIISTYQLTSNAVYDQLITLNPQLTKEKAKKIATWMGQQLFSPNSPFFETLGSLTHDERTKIALACLNYTTTFGLLTAITTTGLLTLGSRGMDATHATLTIASVSLISSALRGLLSIYSFSLNPNTITNVSLLTMLVSSLGFALSKDQLTWTLMLYVFAVANGAGNFSIIAQIAEELPDKVGLATGLSSGIAAFSAFPISIAFACFAPYNQVNSVSSTGVEQTKTAVQYLIATALCTVSLTVNIAPILIKKCSKHPFFNTNNTPTTVQLTEQDLNEDENDETASDRPVLSL